MGKNHFLGQKLHLFGLGKRPKTAVYSEVIPNLKKKIKDNLGVVFDQNYFFWQDGR